VASTRRLLDINSGRKSRQSTPSLAIGIGHHSTSSPPPLFLSNNMAGDGAQSAALLAKQLKGEGWGTTQFCG
jgi:hypothetical protein